MFYLVVLLILTLLFCLNCSTMYLHLGNHEAIDLPVSPMIPFRKICDSSKERHGMYKKHHKYGSGELMHNRNKVPNNKTENKAVKQREQQPQECTKQKTDVLGP